MVITGFTASVFALIQWIVMRMARVFVRSWLSWLRTQLARALVVHEFTVRIIHQRYPMDVELKFKLRNGGSSSVQVDELQLHLFGGDVYVGSITEAQLGTRLLGIEPRTVRGGASATITARFVPSLLFWLGGNGRVFNLSGSRVGIHTVFGRVDLPLEDQSVTSDYERHETRIKGYVESMKRQLTLDT